MLWSFHDRSAHGWATRQDGPVPTTAFSAAEWLAGLGLATGLAWLARALLDDEAVAQTEDQRDCVRRGCTFDVRNGQCRCPVQPPSTAQAAAGIQWVTLPGGTFMMGSTTLSRDEEPVHRVKVKTFQMSKSEVTVGQYRKCVQAGRCTAPDPGAGCNWGQSGREDHPVNCVEWAQASTYSRWVDG